MPATFEYYPFDSGPGANSAEAQWREMMENMMSTGIIIQGGGMDLTGGECAVSPETGLQVKVATGRAWLRGHLFKHLDDYHYISVPANTSGATRRDLVVIRADFVNNLIRYELLVGTTQPVQNASIHDLPLAEVSVSAGANGIASSDIVDRRVSANHFMFAPACQLTNSADRSVAAGASVTLKWDLERFDSLNMHIQGVTDDRITIKEAGIYYVEAMLYWKQPSASNISGMMDFSIYRNRNGTVTQFARDSRYISSSNGVQSTSKLIELLPGDFLYLVVTNGSSVTANVDAATPYSPYFSVTKMGTSFGI